MDRGRILLQNYVSFKELGQMTKDVQLPDHVLGLDKYSCALGERLRPRIKPLADPVCSELLGLGLQALLREIPEQQ